MLTLPPLQAGEGRGSAVGGVGGSWFFVLLAAPRKWSL